MPNIMKDFPLFELAVCGISIVLVTIMVNDYDNDHWKKAVIDHGYGYMTVNKYGDTKEFHWNNETNITNAEK